MAIGDQLPGMGLISYGKFTFADSVTETMACNIRPQYDAGKRTVTHSVWDITLKSYIDGDPSDAAVQLAIAELTKAGQPFKYTGHGCGNLSVNTGGKEIDVVWGPLPQVVSLKPVGGKRVCEVNWSVQVAVPTCSDAVYRFAPLEYSFTLIFDIAQNGFTTRRYSATLRVPNNRVPIGGRLMLDSPDKYREDIVPPLREGFRRTQQSFTLNEAKTTLTASVTDTEFGPNSLPSYIVEGSASHTYSTVSGQGGKAWIGTLEADFEVARAKDGVWAVQQFLNLLKDRYADATQMKTDTGAGRANGPNAKLMPLSFTVSEPNIYGPGGIRGKFTCVYRVNAVSLGEILRSGGLWKPTGKKTGTWDEWYATVKGVTGPRGVAGIRFNANEDQLVDLCQQTNTPQVGSGGTGDLGGLAAPNLLGPGSPFEEPGPGEGWIEVRCFTTVEEDHGTVIAKTLPTEPIPEPKPGGSGWGIFNTVLPSGQSTSGPRPAAPSGQFGSGGTGVPQAASESTVVQRRTSPTTFMYLQGYALRWRWPIPCPEVLDVNGKTLTNCNRLDTDEGFTQGIVGYAGGLPIYHAKWSLRYEASAAIQSVTNIPIPPNSLG